MNGAERLYGAYINIIVAFFSRTMLKAFAMVHCISLMTAQAGFISSSTSWKKMKNTLLLLRSYGKNSLTWVMFPRCCIRTHCLISSVARIAERHSCPRHMYGLELSFEF